MSDWQQIRSEYEQGMVKSIQSFADAHGVAKTTLIDRRNKEGWIHPSDRRPPDRPITKKIVPISLPSMPPNAVEIASSLLADLANLVEGKQEARLTYSEHVKASRALSEYVKVLATAPQDQEAKEGLVIPLDRISPHTRIEISRLLIEEEQSDQEETG